MEFLNGILVEVSGHKLESSQTRVFVCFLSSFSDLQNDFHEKTRSVLRIRDVYPGFWIRIFPSRIRIFSIPDPGSAFKCFNPQKLFLSSRKYDPGCSSRICIPDPDPDFLPILDSGSRGQKGTGSLIWIRNTRLEVSCFADFCVEIFKTREEYDFLWNPPVEGTVNGTEQKTWVFC